MKSFLLALFGGLRNVTFIFIPTACRYYPSCTQYIRQAIEQHGYWRGSWYGFWRVCRCNPFSRGGYDPPY